MRFGPCRSHCLWFCWKGEFLSPALRILWKCHSVEGVSCRGTLPLGKSSRGQVINLEGPCLRRHSELFQYSAEEIIFLKPFYQRVEKGEFCAGIQANVLLRTSAYFLVTEVTHLSFCINKGDIYLPTWQVGKLNLGFAEYNPKEYLVEEMPSMAGSM